MLDLQDKRSLISISFYCKGMGQENINTTNYLKPTTKTSVI